MLRSTTETTIAAVRPPTHRHSTAQARTTPITQNPGTVAFSPGPLTYGEIPIAATATSRSGTSSHGVRRSEAP